MATNQVNESSTAYLTVTFLDKDGAAAAPTAATYQIHDVLSGSQMRAATAITPVAAQVMLTLTPTDNRLLETGQAGEQARRVTVAAVYGDDDGVTAEFVYTVKNLVKAG